MDIEIENARTAWGWAAEQGRVELLERALEGLCCFYAWRARYLEGENACRMAAERLSTTVSFDDHDPGKTKEPGIHSDDELSSASRSPRPILARILAWRMQFNRVLGHTELARQLMRQSIAILVGSEPMRLDGFWVPPPGSTGASVLLQMAHMVNRAQVTNQPLALLLADIDDFRHINRLYGHASGDIVLAGVAHLFRQSQGESGLFHRWGGEEFVMLLPITGERQAVEIAERVRQSVRDEVYESDDGQKMRATISIGIAVYPGDAEDIIMLTRFADRACVMAKRMGKDQICLYRDYTELIDSATAEPTPESQALLQYTGSIVPVLDRPFVNERASALPQMTHIMNRARVEGQSVALLLADVDDLSRVNNTYGSQTGDVVLIGVAHSMQQGIGESDLLVRWGGEEFVMLLSDTGEQQAVKVAEEIRQKVQDRIFGSYDGRDVRVTISIGVALYPRDAGELMVLLRCADHAAYKAKQSGKNQVCLYGQDAPHDVLGRGGPTPRAAASPGSDR